MPTTGLFAGQTFKISNGNNVSGGGTVYATFPGAIRINTTVNGTYTAGTQTTLTNVVYNNSSEYIFTGRNDLSAAGTWIVK